MKRICLSYPLAIMGMVLVLITSCSKNDDGDGGTTVTDADGNVYHTVTIGTQTWMVENLKTTKYNDGTAIPNVTDNTAWVALVTPAYCFYNNDKANKATYGVLYNWYAVNTGKLAPKGWHIPTDEEWTTLENYLIANGYNYDGSTTGNKIAKALASTTLWTSSTVTGTPGNTDYSAYRNKTGFSAIPCGARGTSGGFYGIDVYTDWWTSTPTTDTRFKNCAWRRIIENTYCPINTYFDTPRNLGFSVRCLKD